MLFIFARVLTVGLSVLTLWYVTILILLYTCTRYLFHKLLICRFGVRQGEDPVLLGGIDIKSPLILFSGLLLIVILQIWLLLTFFNYQRKRTSSDTKTSTITVIPPKKNKSSAHPKNKKKD